MSTSRSPTDQEGTYQEGTAYLLAIAGAAARRRWVDMLARFDVTPSQFKVIMSLGELDHLGQRQLAEVIGIDPRNCVPIIDALAERDLLSREIDRSDRRRRVLRLTAKGRRLAQQLKSVNAGIETDLLTPLSHEEQATLRRMLIAILETAEVATAESAQAGA
ncbi:MAG TPA: MarR family winged helix-turn-helix transcriptional regulator [Streptosporangiaceae bacterium]|nr:MarR family winged helix-turn-helix transcriptional regulator [Streptosporangiaceae bacterium]